MCRDGEIEKIREDTERGSDEEGKWKERKKSVTFLFRGDSL